LDKSTAKDFSFSVTLEGASPKCQRMSVRAPSCFSVFQFSFRNLTRSLFRVFCSHTHWARVLATPAFFYISNIRF